MGHENFHLIDIQSQARKMAHFKKALVDAFKPHFKEQGFTKKSPEPSAE
ncbi:MAG TPA: hypothetical protein VG838_17200 [Opitutaceae bacterium]|nr:hypothetical protein [Opitutaceae bacterium]